jgi:hypothetical protein
LLVAGAGYRLFLSNDSEKQETMVAAAGFNQFLPWGEANETAAPSEPHYNFDLLFNAYDLSDRRKDKSPRPTP